jgi:hypothetical protein
MYICINYITHTVIHFYNMPYLFTIHPDPTPVDRLRPWVLQIPKTLAGQPGPWFRCGSTVGNVRRAQHKHQQNCNFKRCKMKDLLWFNNIYIILLNMIFGFCSLNLLGTPPNPWLILLVPVKIWHTWWGINPWFARSRWHRMILLHNWTNHMLFS